MANKVSFLLSATIGLFRYADLTDRIDPGHALPHLHFNLTQLHDNSFGLAPPIAVSGPPLSQR